MRPGVLSLLARPHPQALRPDRQVLKLNTPSSNLCAGEERIENPAHKEPGGICTQYNARHARWLPRREDVTSHEGGGTGLRGRGADEPSGPHLSAWSTNA